MIVPPSSFVLLPVLSATVEPGNRTNPFVSSISNGGGFVPIDSRLEADEER